MKLYSASYQAVGMRPLMEPQELHSEPMSSSTTMPSDEIFLGVKDKIEAELPSMSSRPGDDVTISCLGTGSAMPGKYRNGKAPTCLLQPSLNYRSVSGTLVQIPNRGNILLDCGEGTLGQIRRHFGSDANAVLRDMACMFLSHIHGDHHIGASRVLVERLKASDIPSVMN